uniref:Uncharacterized protein n=1 Tax=Ectopseudomonas oleovorans TaxID=301 RepID=A0A653B5E3_ECTOL
METAWLANSVCLIPAQTTGWSSATSKRIMSLFIVKTLSLMTVPVAGLPGVPQQAAGAPGTHKHDAAKADSNARRSINSANQ